MSFVPAIPTFKPLVGFKNQMAIAVVNAKVFCNANAGRQRPEDIVSSIAIRAKSGRQVISRPFKNFYQYGVVCGAASEVHYFKGEPGIVI